MTASTIAGNFPSFISGLRLIDGGDCQNLANELLGTATALAAVVGGTNVTSTQLSATYSQVDTSTGTNTDGVTLPLAIPGNICMINNNTANTIKVFAQASNPLVAAAGPDQIVAHGSVSLVAGATGITLTTGVASEFVCFAPGVWKQINV